MCSIHSNSTADEGWAQLSARDRDRYEKRLARLADEAGPDLPGALDREAPLRNMPEDLRGIRHKRIGRHRAYYRGHHKQCSYQLVWIKKDKKDDVDAEHDPKFQRKLKNAIASAGGRRLDG